MTRVIVEPQAMELGLLEKEYELVKRDLEAQGHAVEIRRPIETRSIPGLEQALGEAYSVALYLADAVEDPVRDAIALILADRLRAQWRRPRAPKRRAAIYGPDRRVLLEVELPEEEEEARGD